MNLKFFYTNDGSISIYNSELNETYHSTHGAIQESEHIYIKCGLKYYLKLYDPVFVTILEVGFGTGLNALLTLIESFKYKIRVNYISLEPYPLFKEQVDKLNYVNILLKKNNTDNKVLFSLFEKMHNCKYDSLCQITEKFSLLKIKEKIQHYKAKNKFDIIYYDAFAPNKQPEMWTYDVLQKLKFIMHQDSILITYCSQGKFKRNAIKLNYDVVKLKGPIGKSEIVRLTMK